MDFELLYYSGAGGTELLAKIFDRQLSRRGHHVRRSRLKKNGVTVSHGGFDLLGIGFPIYFREAPQLVYDCLKTLEGSGRGMFIFSSKGLYSGNAARNVASFAEARGFEFRGRLEILMPGTDVLLLHARKASLTERFLKAIRSRRISEKVDRFVSFLETGSKEKTPAEKWYTGLDESVAKPLEIRFNNRYQDLVGQFRSITDRCSRCLLCVRGCPRENIRLTEQGIEFGANCDICFRCIHRCPTEAIQIADRTLNTVRFQPERDPSLDDGAHSE